MTAKRAAALFLTLTLAAVGGTWSRAAGRATNVPEARLRPSRRG